MSAFDPLSLLKPRRKVTGISAILLPFTQAGDVDWPAFHAHVQRTLESGLTPAVNMDTGYVNLLDRATQDAVLQQTREVAGGRPFVAGAFVSDGEGDAFRPDEYARRIEVIQSHGGTPIIFQSYGLTRQSGPKIVASYEKLARTADRFLAFELTQDLASFGAIYDLETFAAVMSIPQCVGVKHSSFHREPEWQRLVLRNANRPEFVIFTGNDFAIDMIMYGSDYLLGLSTFAPDLFAQRDHFWETGDPRFYELNDQLQYLGYFAFRRPSPAYKHSAAQFLNLRGWINSSHTHPQSRTRPDSDRDVLRELGQRLGVVSPT
ncbi:dihydrodipicolinate synthase family protein [Schlesneria paludicola]|uniref:dihydrodipicolinate synthase family protein n=1 Tax=Schlesneria paludicola TaxID=360056 RepID=UPI00029ABCB5|nr:dihydrodipicolinate synthase family protein [Schlesneria paludicola]